MWRRFRTRRRQSEQSPLETPELLPPDGSERRRSSAVSTLTNITRSSSRQRTLSADAIVPMPGIRAFQNRLHSREQSQERSRERSGERQSDPLGLSVVYEPDSPPALDIIFVHGLGGSSRQTWSKHRDPDLFWPQKWLPNEPDICRARILCFGYNASFQASGPNSLSNISDFAKELLFEMKFGKDRKMEDLNIGKIPIIFVAHSMGGLVTKKAYILGQNDDNYMNIISSISAIVFLATPHRGTSLAEILNRILAVSIFTHSSKQYIADLNRNSPALEEINEQFRHIAPRLRIVSFYETLQTTIGVKKMMVLEKDSSILGYAGEFSKSLNADHHDVCKYISRQDSNYISVRNVLKSLVSHNQEQGLGLAKYRSPEDAKQIETILAVSEGPDDDYNFFRSRWMPGTCEWILTEPAFAVWMRNTSTSRILWLNALPASGKSILSSFIINYLREAGVLCQFYYFRFGDQTKRSPNSFLRSVAFQLAQEVPAFKQALTELCGEGMRLGKADSRTIWQKLFKTALLKLDVMTPLYWVIDALDESDSPHLLLEILSNISCSKVPIRVFITSRQNPSIALAFERLASSTPVEIISAKHSTSDIRMYVETEIEFMRGDSEFKQRMTEKILERAGGNFLWVHLALKEVLECHFQDAAEQALEDVPAGMEPLYQRMEATMAKTSKGRDRELAKRLLTWAMCSRRSLDLEELSRALEPEFPAVLDMKHTISQVCGQFIVVDTKDRLMMIHQTAREYLTRTPNLTFSITPAETHEDLFTKCVTFLTGYGLRAKLGQNTSQPFLLYAATSWSYHLRSASAASDSVLTLLTKFLHGQYVLTWIYALALFGQLKELVYASQSLTTFVERRRKLDASRIPLFHRVQDSETLELWATDLVKVVGKFSENLMNKPDSIFRLIPQFCPRSSIIYRQFGRKESSPSALSVTGILNNVWDDRLAKVLVGTGCQAVHIACYGSYLAISTSAGSIILWDAVTFEEVRTLPHQEQISTMCFGTSSDKLVSYGFKTTKIWSISSGRQLYCFLNPTSSRALGIIFADNDMTVLIGSDDKIIRRASLKHVTPCWRFFDETVLKEETSLDGTYQNSPCCMIFNNDATQIAVAYRGFPLSVWGVDDSRLIGRCKRVTTRRSSIGNAWTGVDRVTWHPRTGDVLGVYNDGCVFRWHPFEDDGQEIYAAASEIQCSPDGTLFATSDVSGTIKLWNFQHFALIYRLACEYPVTALGFSPDCRRLYDLRGSSCNVWEPNALIRLSETDERGSENASETGSTIIASLASEADSEMLEPITALAASPKGSMYCAGNEDGLVELFDSTSGKVMELWRSRNFMTVDHLIWGQDGRHIASTEFGGTILVKAVDPPASHQRATDWSVRTALEGKVKVESGGIQQLLLSPTSTFLLVSSQGFAQIWSLERGSMVASCISKIPGSKSRWLNHPLYSDQLLEFNFSSVTSYRWEDLTELTTLSFDDIDMSTLDPEDEELPTTTRRPLGQAVPSPSDIHGSVHKALLTQASTHIIVETSRTSAKAQRTKRLRIFETSSFSYLSDVNLASTSTYISPSVLTSLPVSPAILARVVIPLGVLSKEKLVFLDKESWVCTYRLRSGDDASAVRQHFFLPRDWLNSESLELCRVMADGTFLCPRNGEVAVIRSSVGLDW